MGVNGHWYVELEKQAFWRGAAHTWVNRYVMSGAQPSAADALTVITALKQIEDKLHPAAAPGAGVGFVTGRAYPSGKGTFFAIQYYNPSLAPATANGFQGPSGTGGAWTWAPTLETCLLVETPITGLNSRGKPIYLRKYIRGWNSGGVEDHASDGVLNTDATAVNALVAPWTAGMGSSNWVVIANSGAQASAAPSAHGFLVAHQIPRGKKKPKTSASILQIAETALRARGALGLAEDLAEIGA